MITAHAAPYHNEAYLHKQGTGSTITRGLSPIRLPRRTEIFSGWESEGKFEYADGHQEIELALFELGRETGEEKYTNLARFFVDVRCPEHPVPIGILSHLGQAYHQSHLPLREQADAVGHVVRAMFFYAGGADYVLETGDAELRQALDKLWQSVTQHRMYITGGVGSRHDGESFGADYELPNATAYCETCAALGLLMWAWRMLHIDLHSRYSDVMERVLYNGLLVGVSLDGQQYFYHNPLEDNGEHRRQQWFGCACCPPNVLRFLTQLPGYFASALAEGVWLHLYAAGTLEVEVPDGPTVTLDVSTRYPWDGAVDITMGTEGTYSLFLRAPAWCDNPTLHINGAVSAITLKNGYTEVRRTWCSGDRLLWNLPMEPRRIEARPEIAENRGCVALMGGPLVYCVEACDHQNIALAQLALTPSADLLSEWRADLLGGVQVLTAEATIAPEASNWDDNALYRPVRPVPRAKSRGVVSLTAVPYYAWANREAGAMRVWIPTASH